ncbi:helix-turn-helix transcriptional regulator [Solihabitans fulvus]|uniref:Helix-turn-helix transcriptional regulator n=1 Tax=Solihabitans fulvus TaxID=1892852 RepID=A0A5B2XJZ3_9PSEU|nr:helix-turn-helix transcriptional regulator [Solihabitans fulvus]KAA2263395.1 helix-turn-helix transcriptional regulator [Solihabitans fulvus]
MSTPKPNPSRERHWVCAQRLRERRLALGLTQREVVARLQQRGNLTTNRALSAMENGRGLDLGLLPELAHSLCCTVTYLLGLTADPHAWQPEGTTHRVEPAQDPVWHAAGILGPELPAGFAAPGRVRRRNGSAGSANGSLSEHMA